MPTETPIPPKPRSEIVYPDITRLPELTSGRLLFRKLMHYFSKFLVVLFTHCQVAGLENLPEEGPALIVTNHLGDADLIVGFAFTPPIVDPFAKIELHEMPLLGFVLDAYGVIWVHRGRPDRKALRAVKNAMDQKRIVGIAPEGRESLTGSLEEGTDGAAYIALVNDVPIIPITLTGTENKRIFSNMKRLRKTDVTVTIGPSFRLERYEDRRRSIKQGTQRIMNTLANQLPVDYRGYYQ
jgi:1-acyl-sn-glycerol-3-phosphate acyltransferase